MDTSNSGKSNPSGSSPYPPLTLRLLTWFRFVKHYRTHLTPILALSVSEDGKSLAALAEDNLGSISTKGEDGEESTVPVKGSAKVFDVENFDMINILKLPYRPRTCAWVHSKGEGMTLLAMWVLVWARSHADQVQLGLGRPDDTTLRWTGGRHRSAHRIHPSCLGAPHCCTSCLPRAFSTDGKTVQSPIQNHHLDRHQRHDRVLGSQGGIQHTL